MRGIPISSNESYATWAQKAAGRNLRRCAVYREVDNNQKKLAGLNFTRLAHVLTTAHRLCVRSVTSRRFVFTAYCGLGRVFIS